MFDVSFVIPCKNEEKNIAKCLNSIFRQEELEDHFEIKVIDNGSTDGTLEILSAYKPMIEVRVIKSATISELRNIGAKMSKGDWIAFIDADVELDEQWFRGLKNLLLNLKKKGVNLAKVLAGATYSIPIASTWIQSVWYDHLNFRDKVRNNYINGGNLIINKKLFDQVGGFNPNYVTGEDVKLCDSILSNGGIIVKDTALRAVHHGYPRTFKSFFKRERWHGLGMKAYLSRPWKSRDLSLALYYLSLTILTSIFVLFSGKKFVIVGFFLAAVVIPVLPLAIIRCNRKYKNVIFLTLLYITYGFARALALIDIMLSPGLFRKVNNTRL